MDFANVNHAVYKNLHLVYGLPVANTLIVQFLSQQSNSGSGSENLQYRTNDYLTKVLKATGT
jgi:hypothetical protein